MKPTVTIGYITGRTKPRFDWFFQSLGRQKGLAPLKQIIVVDFHAAIPGRAQDIVNSQYYNIIHWILPKPTIWQGRHRVTKQDWWAMSNARNTAICLCNSDWLVLLDDRCVLTPNWWQGVLRAIRGNYAACGAYEKRSGMQVHNGIIVEPGVVTGVDNRRAMAHGSVVTGNGSWFYGCCTCVKLEWWLQVNGYDERMDGLSFEDIIAGMNLHNAGVPIKYDPDFAIIEDRTPSELDAPFRREDKGVSPNDKSHKSLELFGTQDRANHQWDLRQIRQDVLAGNPFPVPTDPDPRDWYDNSPVKDL